MANRRLIPLALAPLLFATWCGHRSEATADQRVVRCAVIGGMTMTGCATNDYVNSAHAGAADAVAHVQGTAANCPNTKIVLGGYSQGAGVMDMTSHQLSPQVANHVAAVALFGNPQSSYAKQLSDNQIPAIDPSYSPRTIDICLPDDNICAEGGSIIAHLGYVPDATNQAATFVAGRL